ncbi:hypothetical protein DL96DRAFT_1620527 [Flagelloscypha sp. PMI_526]|nr:hypothetical protein DL96DRAFT_1620527 [Flagelloscypha sp. PMI_526]
MGQELTPLIFASLMDGVVLHSDIAMLLFGAFLVSAVVCIFKTLKTGAHGPKTTSLILAIMLLLIGLGSATVYLVNQRRERIMRFQRMELMANIAYFSCSSLLIFIGNGIIIWKAWVLRVPGRRRMLVPAMIVLQIIAFVAFAVVIIEQLTRFAWIFNIVFFSSLFVSNVLGSIYLIKSQQRPPGATIFDTIIVVLLEWHILQAVILVLLTGISFISGFIRTNTSDPLRLSGVITISEAAGPILIQAAVLLGQLLSATLSSFTLARMAAQRSKNTCRPPPIRPLSLPPPLAAPSPIYSSEKSDNAFSLLGKMEQANIPRVTLTPSRLKY